MARQIKGITVDIGADTTGLNKALKDVRSQSRKIGRELYKVNRALKFNPDSVELWSQKQELLTERVEETKKKLDVLRQAQDKVEKKFKKGEIDNEQYRKFKRELVKTEDQLSSFTDELEKTQRKATDFSRKMQKAADNMEKFGNRMKGIGNNLNTHVTLPLTAAFFALTEGTRDFRKEISVLKNNADTAGVSMEELDGKMAQLNAVTGELDSNVEGLSSLLAAGFRGEELTGVVNELSGAVTKFPDTLKFENLSESIQETIGSGQSVGQFDEMLSRLGINLDEFNKGLETAKENGKATDYVLETLANNGLTESYEQYVKNNKALVESAEANYDLQSSLAELGAKLEPIMTDIVEGVTDAVDAFNSLSEEEQDMVIFGAGILAALGPVLTLTGNLSITISSLAGAIANAGGLTAALSGLAGALAPFAIGGTAAAGLAYMISGLAEAKKQTDLLNKSIEDLSTMRELQEKLDAEFEERDKLQDLVEVDGFMVDNSFAQERLDATNERIENILEKMNKINEQSEEENVIEIKTNLNGEEGEETDLLSGPTPFEQFMERLDKNIDDYQFKQKLSNITEDYKKEVERLKRDKNNKLNLIDSFDISDKEAKKAKEKVKQLYNNQIADVIAQATEKHRKEQEEARQQELEAEAEFQEEAYENKYEAGKVSLAEYIDYLKDKQSKLKKWSDEWVALNNKINNLEWELGFENETTTDFYGLYKYGEATDQKEPKDNTEEQVKSINWMTSAFVDMGMEIENANQKFVDWKDNLITGLSDAIARGEDLGDVFENIGDQIASMVLQKAIVGPIVNYALGGLNLPTFHEGGFVSPEHKIIEAYKYHSGGTVGANGLKNDEVPAVLETGEYVMSRDQVNAANSPGGKTEIHNHINAIDTKSFAEYVSRNPEAIINVVGQDIMRNGNLRKAIKKS